MCVTQKVWKALGCINKNASQHIAQTKQKKILELDVCKKIKSLIMKK